MMILQGHAVMRGSRGPCRRRYAVRLYEESKRAGVRGAHACWKETGCGAIKVEAEAHGETIRFLAGRGVPVMAHVGLTHRRSTPSARFVRRAAMRPTGPGLRRMRSRVAQAGAFSVVIEAVAEPLARKLTGAVTIPTIGIGASVACDGQILVLEDMLGLSPRVPKFVKRYGTLGPGIEKAISDYASEVRARSFPGPEHVYLMKSKKG
jgi:3-methyl-2-oxobutanoate hydroxymethyltransferase